MTNLPKQRTIVRPATVAGFGFFTNADVTVTFLPAEPDAGITFVRTDLPDRVEIPATIAFAVERHRRTALHKNGTVVELTEHVLAALAGLEIDNCVVELTGPEPPGCDGSARHFVDALLDAGIVEQDRFAAVFGVPEPTIVRSADGSAMVAARPFSAPLAGRIGRIKSVASSRCVIRYELDYGADSPIAPQSAEFTLTPEIFATEIAGARTFILESEIASLRSLGYGQKVTEEDLLVFGKSGVIGNVLRDDNECARHKLLDCIGDFALIGGRITGRFNACRSGHALNRELVRGLLAERVARRAA
ncbi:MAG: UDP-3-O-acyl-N-acetylglucosamine deacetylase [Planctomycetota bacterium]|nr:UDP-3-O-acyl-N-acetylglucosamine deacetylase [Planctomycetaceae bacterium]MDQ3329127.1 UDP-3-O-acyl-N-acetylglucosamine deacetylase [Planctomycetota bacterium]